MPANSYISELSAPVKSFRIFALEQIIREGNTSDVLDALKIRETLEEDEECKLLISYAMHAVTDRMAGATPKRHTENFNAKNIMDTATDTEKLDFIHWLLLPFWPDP